MIEEIGVVTKIEGNMAKVIVQKRGACDGCKAQGTCQTTEEGMEIEAVNMAQAKEGQAVKISIQAQTYIKGTMLFYGLPLVLFIAGAIVGKNIGENFFEEKNSDLVAAIVGFAALVISLLGIKVWAKNTEKKTDQKPVIEEVVGEYSAPDA